MKPPAPAPDTGEIEALLGEGCIALGIHLTPAQRAQLIDYLVLLSRWNRSFNLTAVRDLRDMLTRHVLDSLSVLPHLKGRALADVGSGAGLPGIVLAVAEPRRDFTLVDSNGKKTRFMFQACSELGLENCRVVRARVEAWQPEERFDAVISRAFASLHAMVDTCLHLLNPQGCLLAMKGEVSDEELALLPARVALESVITLQVPGLNEARSLVVMRPRG